MPSLSSSPSTSSSRAFGGNPTSPHLKFSPSLPVPIGYRVARAEGTKKLNLKNHLNPSILKLLTTAKPEVKPPKPRLDEVMGKLRRWHYTGFIDLFDLCMPGLKPSLETWRSGLVEFERLLCDFLEEKDLVAELKEWLQRAKGG